LLIAGEDCPARASNAPSMMPLDRMREIVSGLNVKAHVVTADAKAFFVGL
jgi:hypothetical protein